MIERLVSRFFSGFGGRGSRNGGTTFFFGGVGPFSFGARPRSNYGEMDSRFRAQEKAEEEQRAKFRAEKAKKAEEEMKLRKEREEKKKRDEELKEQVEKQQDLLEKEEQEKRWKKMGATSYAEKQEWCLHSRFWPKLQQKRKFKCTSCWQKRGMTAFKCPHCSLLVCQQCNTHLRKILEDAQKA